MMKQPGDRIEIVIRAPHQAKAATSVSGTLINPGKEIRLKGKIVGDYNDQWLVELDADFNGKNKILVLKSQKLVS